MTGIKNILVVVAFCELVSSAIISTPANVALQRGASTELICRANSGSSVSSWTFTAYQGSAKDVIICSREIGMVLVSNRTSFQEIIDKDGFFNIKTDSVQPHDAGVYTCNIRLAEGEGLRIEKRSAHLIVLDSVPNCTSVNYSTNGRKFKRLSCSVSFRGDWAPVMEWRQGGFHGSIVTTGVQSHTLSNFVSQNISIPVDVDGENAISYTCIIFFMGNFSASATNIPNFTFIWPGRHTESVSAPANTAVIKGNNVRLLCKTQKGWPAHSWTFMAAGSTIAERIYDGIEPAAKQHTFELGHKSFDLSIRPTHLKDAGVYACNKKSIIGGEEKNVQSSAHLIVLEANPHCGVEAVTGNSTEETFRLWCSVRYRGSWTPVMEWRQDAEDGLLMHDVQNITVPNNEVTYILTIVARFAKKNTVYFCRTYFSETLGSFAFVSATNVPEYSHLWTSPPINHSSEIPLLTMIVTLVGIFLLMFMALTVYHVFFKRMIAGRLKKQNIASNMQPDEGNQQPGSYATIQDDTTRIEPETLEPEYEESILEAAPNQPPGVYNEMGPNAITRPHCYSRLSSTPPLLLSVTGHIEDADADSTMINDNETHHYANFTSK